MADYITIQQLINEAMRTQTTVHIRYRDYHGNISLREISPSARMGRIRKNPCLLSSSQ
jgi:hypothetical protein